MSMSTCMTMKRQTLLRFLRISDVATSKNIGCCYESDSDYDSSVISDSESCTSECCNLGHGKSQQARYVQGKWFNQYRWLTLCESRQKLLCFYCSTAARRKLMTFNTKADSAFSHFGFNNWKKSLRAIC